MTGRHSPVNSAYSWALAAAHRIGLAAWRDRAYDLPVRKAAVLLAITWISARAPIAVSDPRPKLAVVIVVDQMRADYVERFRGDWRSGLERLVTRGPWFRQTAYPYSDTVRPTISACRFC